MSTVRKLISPQEYLAIERAAETRSEYLNGEMFAMAGASVRHILITANLTREIGNRLEDSPCLVLPTEMRVKINSTGLYTYPDLAIVCEKLELEAGSVDTLLNPSIIVEVLSESTEKYDRGVKFDHYRELGSLREYVLVSQEKALIERYARQADGMWTLRVFKDMGAEFTFDSIDLALPMSKIYSKVEFIPPSDKSRPGW
jgi:Uma2 family endonuclease